MEPGGGRTLSQTLERASRSPWPQLPHAVGAFIVARALQAHERSGQQVSAATVLLAFEGGVELDASAPAGDGVGGAVALLRQLIGAAGAPAALHELAHRAWGSPRELREALEQWLAAAAPGLTGEVLRELLGGLFDGELLATGRLFISHPPARERLAQLRGKAPPLPGAPAGAAAAPGSRQRPVLLISLAALGLCATALASAAWWLSRHVGAVAPPAPEAVAKPSPLKPEVTPPAAVATPQPSEPALPPVSFDAEAAPLTLRLTQAHQTVVPKRHCFEVPKKGVLSAEHKATAGLSVPRGGNTYGNFGRSKGYTLNPFPNSTRALPLFGLFSPRLGPSQLVNLDEPITFAEPGSICVFAPTDRSLEQETSQASVDIAGQAHRLKGSLHVVDPDDRFRVRSFVPDKKWVVRVSATSPPWPVLFVDRGQTNETSYVLDQPELSFTGARSMWITVPVYEQVPYAREISIQLAPGERLEESAQDLLTSGRQSLSTGAHGSAASTLDRCINAYPRFPECHLALGDAYWALRYRDEARTEYREYLRLSPEGAERQRVLAVLNE